MLDVNNGIQQADGGYWYIVGVIPAYSGYAPELPDGLQYAAWYCEIGGTQYALVRLLAPRMDLNMVTGITGDQFLAAANSSSIPYSRIWGS